MKKISSIILFALFTMLAWNCASEEVKQTTPEPAPSKKPTLKEAVKMVKRDIK